MKIFFAILSSTLPVFCFSQATMNVEKVIADSGKHEFRQQAKSGTADYTAAYRILTNQVNLNPRNAELHYFLGYTIDRLNMADASEMPAIKKEMTIKASEQFEEVNRLQSTYKGDQDLLDPYSKISSIWGSLAQAYLNRNLDDSAHWAFTEGKRRGGFIEPLLELNRQMLNSCGKNAILVTSGDNITIPAWYLQAIENYRTDVTVVDGNLVNAAWYIHYLRAKRNLKMSFSDNQVDSMDYLPWKSKVLRIVNPKDTAEYFSWRLKPTYMNGYILKGDRMLLDIMRQNFFERPMYFNCTSDTSYNLFLAPYFIDEGLVYRVDKKIPDYRDGIVPVSKNLYNYNINSISNEDILKSKDAIFMLSHFRLAYYNNIALLLKTGNNAKARELALLVKEKFSKDKLPYISELHEQFFEEMFDKAVKE